MSQGQVYYQFYKKAPTVSSLYPYRLCSKYKILKVLLDGLHDPESSLNKLREPNDVRRPVMEMIWDQVTEDQGLTGSRYPTRPDLFFNYPTRPVPKIENDRVAGN